MWDLLGYYTPTFIGCGEIFTCTTHPEKEKKKKKNYLSNFSSFPKDHVNFRQQPAPLKKGYLAASRVQLKKLKDKAHIHIAFAANWRKLNISK